MDKGQEMSLMHFWKEGGLFFSKNDSPSIGVHPESLGESPVYGVAEADLSPDAAKEDPKMIFRKQTRLTRRLLASSSPVIEAFMYVPEMKERAAKEE